MTNGRANPLDAVTEALAEIPGTAEVRRNGKGSLLNEEEKVVVMRSGAMLVFRLAPARVDELCVQGRGIRYRNLVTWFSSHDLSHDETIALAREALAGSS